MKTRAYCFASGQIAFGATLPPGALPIASSHDAKALGDFISAKARHAYDGKTLLVPGIPEAEDQSAALDALQAWTRWIAESAPEGVETIYSRHRAATKARP